MKAIIGLGNPGEKYANTRHNVGFDIIDVIAEMLNVNINKNRHHAVFGETIIDGEKVLLVKPNTYMNDSGKSVYAIMEYYHIPVENVLIIVDDIDIGLGQIRIRKSGGPGTHNGLRSIVQSINTCDFPRIRVGVGSPNEHMDLADFVLSRYQTKQERDIALDTYQTAAKGAICFAKEGVLKAMNSYNRRNVTQ